MTTYRMPSPQSPIVDQNGKLKQGWHQYILGIQDKRAEAIADLAGGATTAECVTKINDLLAALRVAGLLRE